MTNSLFDVNKMKTIAHSIVDDELRECGIKTNLFPITFIEYYSDYLSKKSFSLMKKIEFFGVPIFHEGGFRDGSTDDIVIFLHSTHKSKLIGRNIFKLIENCYHESRHVIQDTFDSYSYEGFLKEAEDYISSQGFDADYFLDHDKYFCEIDAHLYGVSKAREYMKKHYFDLYVQQKEEIDRLEKIYAFDFFSYDVVNVVENLLKMRLKSYKSYSSLMDNPIFVDMYFQEKVPEVLNIFLNWNCTFKKVGQIINDPNFEKVDKRFVSAFFSSKYFLESVDMESLSSEEIKVVNDSLQYIATTYRNQNEFIDKSLKEKVVSLGEYLKIQKYLVMRISFVNTFLSVIRKIYSGEKNRNRIERMNRVNSNLKKSKRIIGNKVNSGFIMYDIFYIVGLLFSILTIIYIMIR